MASEQLRMRVLALTLLALLVGLELLVILARDVVQQFAQQAIPTWGPLQVIGPFLAYETIVILVLRYRASRGLDMPTPARFANAVIETSLPTVIIWWASKVTSEIIVFTGWPSTLYYIYIVASTLRLSFLLSAFTGVVAAAGYLGVTHAVLPLSAAAANPLFAPYYHIAKAALMVAAGIVAGLVAVQLRAKFRDAMEQARWRERVTNLFGQHVSPAVVERLLDSPTEFSGETREICVMFLDIRDFTANARNRPPEEVVAFLNRTFAFMIEAVDRHGGFINKFLGDGFMAVFGAPLDDPASARHAVAAAQDILAEIGRLGLADGPWPLRIGIGLHVGSAVTGTVGSPRRKEFTAIGDTVNLASRLEQLTKDHGARLIVSDAVVCALGDAADGAIPLGAVHVKGYAEPVKVWRLDR